MNPATQKLWAKQDRHEGDRRRLFTAVADAVHPARALYPGSFVDVAPSFVIDHVTYLDMDKRAARFFADTDGVQTIINDNVDPDHPLPAAARTVEFVAADYTDDELGLADEHYDLLVSLYAGFVSEHCTRHLRIGGTLLVNPSHGDAAMASIDPRYQLVGVVFSRDGNYRVSTAALDAYLQPKVEQEVTPERLHELGRGIAYTKSPFAYLFERTA